MAKFLQSTLDELSLQSKGEAHSHNAKEFKQFFDNVRFSLKFLFLECFSKIVSFLILFSRFVIPVKQHQAMIF